jgi:Ca2+-binding EF-hand superfamily protein
MNKKYIITLGLALALPLHAEEATAPDAKAKKKPDMEAIFNKKDADKDGFVSKEEFVAKAKDPAKLEPAFAKKDKDADGKLSKEEFIGKPGGKKKKKGGEE